MDKAFGYTGTRGYQPFFEMSKAASRANLLADVLRVGLFTTFTVGLFSDLKLYSSEAANEIAYQELTNKSFVKLAPTVVAFVAAPVLFPALTASFRYIAVYNLTKGHVLWVHDTVVSNGSSLVIANEDFRLYNSYSNNFLIISSGIGA